MLFNDENMYKKDYGNHEIIYKNIDKKDWINEKMTYKDTKDYFSLKSYMRSYSKYNKDLRNLPIIQKQQLVSSIIAFDKSNKFKNLTIDNMLDVLHPELQREIIGSPDDKC